MSLSSDLVMRQCPKCGRQILASANLCQFCGAEVVPTQELERPPDTSQILARLSGPKRKANGWQAVANTILGILWMIAGFVGVICSLAFFGLYGLVFAAFSAATCWLGYGIIMQESLALWIARCVCALEAVFAFYRLVATPALISTGHSDISVRSMVLLILVAGFQAYIFWSVGD